MDASKSKQVTQYGVLTQAVYASLAANFPIVVNRETTDIQAGYHLGVQAVLQKLREGFVIGQS
jgi:hypothetical protein